MSKDAYYDYLKKWKMVLIQCPECGEHIKLKEYATEHVKIQHEKNIRYQCLFCEERFRRGKYKFEHLIPCVKRFHEKWAVRSVPEMPMQVEERVTPCSECMNFKSEPRKLFGRKKDGMSKFVGLYRSWYERPEQYLCDEGIEFSKHSGLRHDVYCIVQRFLQGGLEWCHLMVTHQNFKNFITYMEPIKNRIFLLPFWCLCDGLKRKGEKAVTHRHMMMAYEPECGFKDVWRDKVKYKMVNGKSKYCVDIKDAFHLIRVIMYVSQRKSSCDGNKIPDNLTKGTHFSHFYINRPLHEHAVAWMCMMFEGGMERLLKEQLRNKNVVEWRNDLQKIRDVHHNVKFAVPIRVTGFKFLKCVLPLAKCYEPTDKETDLHLTLYRKKKLYLQVNQKLEELCHADWCDYQVAKGNTLWCIRDELYVLGPGQQNMVNQIKPAVLEDTEKAKKQVERKYRQLLKNQEENMQKQYEKECQEMKMNIQHLEAEREEMKRNMQQQYEKECQELKTEIERLKKTLKKEREEWRKKMEYLKMTTKLLDSNSK